MSQPPVLVRLPIEIKKEVDVLRWLFRRSVSAFERQWDYDASYLREIIDVSPRAAWRFVNATRLGSYRRDVPIEALFAAGITAVRSEDCGPCTQLSTAMAERRGVDPEILRAILKDDVAAMPDDVALAWRFTKAILARDPAADDYRAVILSDGDREPSSPWRLRLPRRASIRR